MFSATTGPGSRSAVAYRPIASCPGMTPSRTEAHEISQAKCALANLATRWRPRIVNLQRSCGSWRATKGREKFPAERNNDEMRRIKRAASVVAVVAGILAPILAAGSANASTYTISFIDRCARVGPSSGDLRTDCFQLGAYSTYTQTQVWINGSTICHPYQGSVNITWCGVGGGNGTGALNIGDNFTFPGATGSYYERMDIFAGDAGCGTWGSNSDGNGIYQWGTTDGICQQPA